MSEPEPTIDEMLAWLDSRSAPVGYTNTQLGNAIRAILEQHRALSADGYVIDSKGVFIPKGPTVAIIRAFVERVEQRADYWHTENPNITWMQLLRNELAAMEKEAK